MKQHEKALADFERALELDPQDNCCAHTNRAYSYMMTGAMGKAVPDLVFAAEERDDHWAARQLALMYGFGRYGIKADPALGKRWCERAAKQGETWPMNARRDVRPGWRPAQPGLRDWFESAATRGRPIAAISHTCTGPAKLRGMAAARTMGMRAATQGNERARSKLLSSRWLHSSFTARRAGLIRRRRKQRRDQYFFADRSETLHRRARDPEIDHPLASCRGLAFPGPQLVVDMQLEPAPFDPQVLPAVGRQDG